MPYLTMKRLRDGGVAVTTVLRTPRGPIALAAKVPAHYLTIAGGDEDEERMLIAGIFDDIANVASKVLHSEVVQNGAAAIASVYGVPPGVTKKALDLSGDLVDKARKGDKRSKRKIARVRARAAAGERNARTAMAALAHADQARNDTRAAIQAVGLAARGDRAARERLERLAARARAERDNPVVQRAANAVRSTVEAIRRAPPPPPARAPGVTPRALPASATPATSSSAPRVLRVRNEGGLRVLEIAV